MKRFKKLPIIILVVSSLLVAIVIYTVLSGLIIVRVTGNSMEPHFSNGEIILLKRNLEYGRGDIIIFTPPEAEGVRMWALNIKKILALPGDTIVINNSEVLILYNNEVVKTHSHNYTITEEIVIENINGYFVIGYNEDFSRDSLFRFYEYGEIFLIPKNNILSGVSLR